MRFESAYLHPGPKPKKLPIDKEKRKQQASKIGSKNKPATHLENKQERLLAKLQPEPRQLH
ncbi:MAG: hypothetical protein NZ901_13115, partial [Geminocystis sp.]|nr:hypothetical protein [Geminocystis sp.]